MSTRPDRSWKSLEQADIGEKLVVKQVHASPAAEDWRFRLEAIGFIPGESVEPR